MAARLLRYFRAAVVETHFFTGLKANIYATFLDHKLQRKERRAVQEKDERKPQRFGSTEKQKAFDGIKGAIMHFRILLASKIFPGLWEYSVRSDRKRRLFLVPRSWN